MSIRLSIRLSVIRSWVSRVNCQLVWFTIIFMTGDWSRGVNWSLVATLGIFLIGGVISTATVIVLAFSPQIPCFISSSLSTMPTNRSVLLSHRVYTPVPNEHGDTSAHSLVAHCTSCDRCSVGGEMAIYIDGACYSNGTSHARAGMGVFICCGSNLNVSAPLTDGPQTNQRAEIRAAIAALKIVRQLFYEGEFRQMGHRKGVVLILDSAYVTNAMTNWVGKWSKNGGKTSEGKSVANIADFLELERHVLFLENNRVPVKFWRVPRSENTCADGLAKQAITLWGAVVFVVEPHLRSFLPYFLFSVLEVTAVLCYYFCNHFRNIIMDFEGYRVSATTRTLPQVDPNWLIPTSRMATTPAFPTVVAWYRFIWSSERSPNKFSETNNWLKSYPKTLNHTRKAVHSAVGQCNDMSLGHRLVSWLVRVLSLSCPWGVTGHVSPGLTNDSVPSTKWLAYISLDLLEDR